MKLTIPSNFFYQFLFFLAVFIPYLDIFELTISVWVACFVASMVKQYSFSIVKLTIPFLLILFIAIVVMFFQDNSLYFIIRDITYLIKPVVGLLLGYQLCQRNLNNAFQLILKTAYLIAIYHLTVLAISIVFFRANNVNLIREYGGYFSDYEVYALVILIFYKNFQIKFDRKKRILYTIVIGLSVFMYLARTNFLQLLILFLGMKGYLEINKKSIAIITSIVVLTVAGYSSILYINPKRGGDGIEAFLYKIKVAPMETFKTKIKRDDWKDFNDNYRSYENIMTIRQVSSDGTLSILFGKGLGSRIDLKQKVYLGDMQLRHISILHNGFMIVFLKSGLIGILIYFFSIAYFFKRYKIHNQQAQSIRLLFIGTGVFLVLSNWVFLGFYNLIDTKTILIGFLIAYFEKNNNPK
jgi:hypothetical protein